MPLLRGAHKSVFRSRLRLQGGEGGRAFVPFSFLSILHSLSYFSPQPAEPTSLLFAATYEMDAYFTYF
jgi:hypothetical protein